MKPTRQFDPVGVWTERYSGASRPEPYGVEDSYRLAAALLDRDGTIEDWGCGLAYARKFFHKARYIGIDGSKSAMCDEVGDLKTRSSNPDFILLRHVLEHNLDWEIVLGNAIRCARSKLFIICFTALSDGETAYAFDSDGIPCISFSRADLISAMLPIVPLEISVGSDTCWLLEKDGA